MVEIRRMVKMLKNKVDIRRALNGQINTVACCLPYWAVETWELSFRQTRLQTENIFQKYCSASDRFENILERYFTPSALARRRQMSHKITIPVLPTPALQWTTTGPFPGGVIKSFFRYVTIECVDDGMSWSGHVV